MAEENNKQTPQRLPERQRETRSESFIHLPILRTLSGSKDENNSPHDALRQRSYSTNDSADYEQNISQPDGQRQRRSSFLEMIIGRRSMINTGVVSDALPEESSSAEDLSQLQIHDSEEVISVETGEDTEMTGDGGIDDAERTDSELSVHREITQTDHLNKRLLNAFLERINKFAGNSKSEADLNVNGEEVETARASNKDYNTLYTDDFLMNHIYRKLDKKKDG